MHGSPSQTPPAKSSGPSGDFFGGILLLMGQVKQRGFDAEASQLGQFRFEFMPSPGSVKPPHCKNQMRMGMMM